MKNCFLEGDRIYLRVLLESDINGNYINWLNDEEVCRFNAHHVFPYSKDLAEDYIKKSWKSRDAIILAIALKSNDRHIGNIALYNIDAISRSAELTIILGEKDCWGSGYSREASFLLLKHAFLAVNLNSVYCGTSEENLAMQKLAKYLGMVQEGRRRQAFYKNGKFVDVLEYGITKEEFLAQLKHFKESINHGEKTRESSIA